MNNFVWVCIPTRYANNCCSQIGLPRRQVSSWLGTMSGTGKNKHAEKQASCCTGLLGHDAVICCALADIHFQFVSLRSADI